MPPQSTPHVGDDDHHAAALRRSGSESDLSQMGDLGPNYRDYRVKRSSLIGYVTRAVVVVTIFSHDFVSFCYILFLFSF